MFFSGLMRATEGEIKMHIKWIFYMGLLLLVPVLLAMGSFGGKPAVRENAPETEKRLDAVVVDMEDVKVTVTHISYDGELYIPVYRGRALITIPFQQIDRIEMGKKENSRRHAKIFFKNERTDDFLIDEGILFIGRLSYGTFQIQAKDVQSLQFQAAPLENPN